MTLPLEKIATIKPGFPFRSSIKTQKPGEVAVIQMRDASPEHGLETTDVAHVELPGKKIPDWLMPGDLLFVARGNNNFAAYIDELDEKTVCTPHFFQIRIKSFAMLLPEFLAWQINQTQAQAYFSRLAQGSVLRNIKKSELAKLPVVIPPQETQQKIIAVNQLIKKEMRIMRTLMNNRQQMMNTIARQTLNAHNNFTGI